MKKRWVPVNRQGEVPKEKQQKTSQQEDVPATDLAKNATMAHAQTVIPVNRQEGVPKEKQNQSKENQNQRTPSHGNGKDAQTVTDTVQLSSPVVNASGFTNVIRGNSRYSDWRGNDKEVFIQRSQFSPLNNLICDLDPSSIDRGGGQSQL